MNVHDVLLEALDLVGDEVVVAIVQKRYHAEIARHADCLDDIDEAKRTFAALGLDFLAIDLTDPAIGFPVVQVVVPGYSDVLPYHAPSSPALFRAITRSEVLASYPTLPCGSHQV